MTVLDWTIMGLSGTVVSMALFLTMMYMADEQ